MYMPPAFRNQDIGALHEIMRRHSLGTLVTAAPGLTANHIPFVLHPEDGSHGFGLLRAHLARGNDQAALRDGRIDCLVVFLGVDHYVTPSWYETKRLTGKVVPTWNYISVHATGPLRIIDDPAWVRRQIDSLTVRHETERPAPWAVSDAPEDFVAAQLRGIVGLEIDIASLEGKWKLSQNRTLADRQGVADGLERDGDPAGAAMAGLIDRT